MKTASLLQSFVGGRVLLAVGVMGAMTTYPETGNAITRDEVMVRARAFAYHPWRCSQNNLTASCSAAYKSVYTPGDYVGLPYDWGGYRTLFAFDQAIANGAGAGSYPNDGILSCTVGLDCSGYVSQCWDTTHLTTSSLHTQSSVVDLSQVLAGDAFNQAGYHVILYSHQLANGDPIFYEAIGYNVHITAWGGWSHIQGYQPRRYNGITGTTMGNPPGTPDNPIPIPSFPFTDSRDTTQSASDVLDGCGAAPTKPQSGPEYIYVVTFTQPGQLTVSVSDDVGVDIDVHLYTSMNTNDCIARDDATFTRAVDCGTYYIVADTYGSGLSNAGPYTLTVDFTPSSSPCGSGPPAYNPTGNAGDACAFPGHEHLPFCNPNLGGDTCLYTTGPSATSFCTHPCHGVADCVEFPGGCCLDIGSNEFYCLPSPYCGGTPGDAGTDGSTETDASVGQDAEGPEGGTETDSGEIPDATSQPEGAIGQDGAIQQDSGMATDSSLVPGEGGIPEDASSNKGATPGVSEEEDGGCACRMVRGGSSSAGWLVALLLGLIWTRRRR